MSEFYLVYIEFFLIRHCDSDAGLQNVLLGCHVLSNCTNTLSYLDDFAIIVDDEDTKHQTSIPDKGKEVTAIHCCPTGNQEQFINNVLSSLSQLRN